MKDRVVYTAVVGDIDALQQPGAIDPGYDYICFVRKGECGSGAEGAWQIREIPADIGDDRMLARYAKTHPEELLKGYTYRDTVVRHSMVKVAN